MLLNKNPQHHHIIFPVQKKSNYNGMQKKKEPWQNLRVQVCNCCLNFQSRLNCNQGRLSISLSESQKSSRVTFLKDFEQFQKLLTTKDSLLSN